MPIRIQSNALTQPAQRACRGSRRRRHRLCCQARNAAPIEKSRFQILVRGAHNGAPLASTVGTKRCLQRRAPSSPSEQELEGGYARVCPFTFARVELIDGRPKHGPVSRINNSKLPSTNSSLTDRPSLKHKRGLVWKGVAGSARIRGAATTAAPKLASHRPARDREGRKP